MKRWLGMGMLGLLLAGASLTAAQSGAVCDTSYVGVDESPRNLRAVVAACDDRLDGYPGDWNAYFSRGYTHMLLENYDEAIADFSKTIFFSPKDSSGFNNRGYIYEILGNDTAAVIDYSRALAVYPEYITARINRAWTWWRLGEPEAARADAQFLVDTGLSLADGYWLFGQFALEEDDTETAIGYFDQVIAELPDWPSAYLSRGFAYWQHGDFAAAAPDYLRWVEEMSSVGSAPDVTFDGEPVTFTLPGGEHYRVEFEGQRGDRLTARIEGLVETVDPALILLGPDGTPLTVDDDGGLGLAEMDAVIDGFRLPETGTYTLVVGFAGGGDQGEVRLRANLRS